MRRLTLLPYQLLLLLLKRGFNYRKCCSDSCCDTYHNNNGSWSNSDVYLHRFWRYRRFALSMVSWWVGCYWTDRHGLQLYACFSWFSNNLLHSNRQRFNSVCSAVKHALCYIIVSHSDCFTWLMDNGYWSI